MFRSILVPVDLSEMDVVRPALDKALALAGMTGASLHLVYVRSIMPVTFMEYVPPSFDEEQQDECEKKLDDLASTLPVARERITTRVRLGGVYNEVLAEAEATHSDLIVVGSHRPAMSTYLLGSNAATIVRHAPCSVLVVRMPEADRSVSS